MKRKKFTALIMAAMLCASGMDSYAASPTPTVDEITSSIDAANASATEKDGIINQDYELIKNYSEEGKCISGNTQQDDLESILSAWEGIESDDPVHAKLKEYAGKIRNVQEEIAKLTSERDALYAQIETLEAQKAEILATTASFEGVALNYSAPYAVTEDSLTMEKGVVSFNGHKETWYTEKKLPGTGLDIPGRHVADDGTIRDENGYICAAADYSFLPKGTLVMTSLGPAKIYDTGCKYNVVDIYTNW